MQLKNAYFPISVTLSGIVIEVKPVQSENACQPMDVTLSGIVIEVKPVQPLNASQPMYVTPSSIITDLILSIGIETISSIFLFSISLPITKCPSFSPADFFLS